MEAVQPEIFEMIGEVQVVINLLLNEAQSIQGTCMRWAMVSKPT